MSMSWSTIMGAVAYGYAPHYLIRIEGCAVMPAEYIGDAVAPTGYTLDASLVIDGSARVGSVVDPKTHVSRGFDLEVRLLATSAIAALMQRPTKTTTLTADITATDTTIPVASALGWAGADLHIGTSREEYGGHLLGSFVSVTRGTYGRQRSYKAGTIVANGPYVWKGRRVDLFVVLLDPTGRYVQEGADILSSACMVWSGYVQERPWRDGNEWVLQCRDQVRRLAQPLGVAASGKARWSTNDDTLLAIDRAATLTLSILDDGTGTYTDEEYQLAPFTSLSTTAYQSQLRQAIVDAIDTARGVSGSGWREEAMDDAGLTRRYRLFVPVVIPAAGANLFVNIGIQGSGNTPYIFSLLWNGEIYVDGLDSVTVNVETALYMRTRVVGAGLAVELEDVAPDDLPTEGYVQIEGGGASAYRHYTGLATDDANSALVRLTMAEDSGVQLDDIEAIARAEVEGDAADVSAKFYWLDSGRLPDILRRAIVSTGDAQNGARDTLPKGQGLGLPYLDDASFDDVFDAAYRDLSFVLASESGTTLEELVGGILRLSQRALVTRRAADGSTVDIAAVRVGTADAVPVTTITDAMLVASKGRRPVRVRDTFGGPQAIQVTCRTLPIGDAPEGDGKILLRDPHLVDWTGERWDLDIYGVGRAELYDSAKVWAMSRFRGGENRQVLELDVGPEVDAQPGDVVALSLQDPQLWDYATGTPGLAGLARCVGAQFAPDAFTQTLTVEVDGILAAGPMSPSLPIIGVNGGGTTPTSIDLDEAYYDLLAYARDGQSSWKVLAYLRGFDAGRAEYTISTVTQPGGGVARLTVTAYPSSPSVSLSTSYRLTWPVQDDCTDTQAPYLHASDKVQWS